MTDLQLRGISKSFGRVQALDATDLSVPDGELVAVLGPSGCGKTTMLRVVAGFERPDAGQVSLGDRTVVGDGKFVPPEHRKVGLVPQEAALFPHLDVERNVGFGLPRSARSARVAELLELVGLPGYQKRRPQELSGGEQSRVALARALAPRPSLILLDEPFAALDAGLRSEVRNDVRRVLRETSATGVLVTHDQEEALSIADRVAVMRAGRVIQQATPVDLYSNPADLHVARFVGDAVELEAVSESGVAQTVLGAIEVRDGVGGRGVVLLRPEQLELNESGVTGSVLDIVFHGHDALVRVGLPTLEVVLRVVTPVSVRVGDTVAVKVRGQAQFYPLV